MVMTAAKIAGDQDGCGVEAALSTTSPSWMAAKIMTIIDEFEIAAVVTATKITAITMWL